MVLKFGWVKECKEQNLKVGLFEPRHLHKVGIRPGLHLCGPSSTMDRKLNTCCSIEIRRIEEDQQGNYTVYVKDYYPRKGWFCPMMMVCPVHAVKAPIPTGTVTFQHEIVQ